MKKLLSIVLVCLLLVGCVLPVGAVEYGEELKSIPQKTYTQTFADVPENHWAFRYIAEMVDRGVLSGYPDGNFYTSNNVTRAEFAKIMCLAAGLSIETVYGSDFDDVGSADWFLPYVETAKYYLSGFTANGRKMFRPKAMALREDIAVALVKLKGYSVTGADESILQTMFTDWQSISADARKYVAAALENGLVSGYEDRTFRGQGGVTRAEAATLLWRAYQYGDANKSFEVEQSPKQETERAEESSTMETTAETEQEKTSKMPYVVNTLTAAAVKDTFAFSTYDEKDTIYYFDDDDHTIYKLAISTGSKTKLVNIDTLQYPDVEITEKQVEKQVPKTVKRLVEREITVEVPIEEPAEVPTQPEETAETPTQPEETPEEQTAELSAATRQETRIVTEEIEETVYETVTETVQEKTVKGTYKDFDIDGLYFNTGDNNLYIAGAFTHYATDSSLRDEYKSFGALFKLNGSQLTSVMNNSSWHGGCCEFTGICGNFSDGRMICVGWYNTGSSDSSSYNAIWSPSSDTWQAIGDIFGLAFVAGNNIYSADESGLYQYQFTSANSERIADTVGYASYYGIRGNQAYFWNTAEGTIARAQTSGKIAYLEGIDTKNGVEILDFKNMPPQAEKHYIGNSYSYSHYSRLYATAKEDFVFYDTACSSWRILKKQ